MTGTNWNVDEQHRYVQGMNAHICEHILTHIYASKNTTESYVCYMAARALCYFCSSPVGWMCIIFNSSLYSVGMSAAFATSCYIIFINAVCGSTSINVSKCVCATLMVDSLCYSDDVAFHCNFVYPYVCLCAPPMWNFMGHRWSAQHSDKQNRVAKCAGNSVLYAHCSSIKIPYADEVICGPEIAKILRNSSWVSNAWLTHSSTSFILPVR